MVVSWIRCLPKRSEGSAIFYLNASSMIKARLSASISFFLWGGRVWLKVGGSRPDPRQIASTFNHASGGVRYGQGAANRKGRELVQFRQSPAGQ